LGRWFFQELGASTEAGYRAFNERYFASFHQQERMLADGPRMRFYQAAINRHVQPGARVIDLGSGTGILAAMAALLALSAPSQIMFGSDYPYVQMEKTVGGLDRLGYGPDLLGAINRESALKLFPRFA
jgi:hypothetical protein